MRNMMARLKRILIGKVPDKDLHAAISRALNQIDPEEASKAGVK